MLVHIPWQFVSMIRRLSAFVHLLIDVTRDAQTLLKEFVVERLHEEEKREGMVG